MSDQSAIVDAIDALTSLARDPSSTIVSISTSEEVEGGEDNSNVVPTDDVAIRNAVLQRLRNDVGGVKYSKFAVGGKAIKFPVKLMYVLDTCKDLKDVVSWSEDGESFFVYDPLTFEVQVLPKMFKEAKFTSFLRKLTRWGFAKKSTPCGINLSHENFKRDGYSSCIDITCSSKMTLAKKRLEMTKTQENNEPSNQNLFEVSIMSDEVTSTPTSFMHSARNNAFRRTMTSCPDEELLLRSLYQSGPRSNVRSSFLPEPTNNLHIDSYHRIRSQLLSHQIERKRNNMSFNNEYGDLNRYFSVKNPSTFPDMSPYHLHQEEERRNLSLLRMLKLSSNTRSTMAFDGPKMTFPRQQINRNYDLNQVQMLQSSMPPRRDDLYYGASFGQNHTVARELLEKLMSSNNSSGNGTF